MSSFVFQKFRSEHKEWNYPPVASQEYVAAFLISPTFWVFMLCYCCEVLFSCWLHFQILMRTNTRCYRSNVKVCFIIWTCFYWMTQSLGVFLLNAGTLSASSRAFSLSDLHDLCVRLALSCFSGSCVKHVVHSEELKQLFNLHRCSCLFRLDRLLSAFGCLRIVNAPLEAQRFSCVSLFSITKGKALWLSECIVKSDYLVLRGNVGDVLVRYVHASECCVFSFIWVFLP